MKKSFSFRVFRAFRGFRDLKMPLIYYGISGYKFFLNFSKSSIQWLSIYHFYGQVDCQ